MEVFGRKGSIPLPLDLDDESVEKDEQSPESATVRNITNRMKSQNVDINEIINTGSPLPEEMLKSIDRNNETPILEQDEEH